MENQDYRPNVAAIVLSPDYPEKREFMIARRKGMRKGWQFPQGGIDPDETLEEALRRELREEIGTDAVEIIAEYPEWISYDFPKTSRNPRRYPYKGQRQRYFLVRLLEEAVIDLEAFEFPEFEEYKFVTMEELFRRITFFKRKVYRQVIDHFIKEGLL
jgi:putative (di)nucleoside polyphosphate hydrolase